MQDGPRLFTVKIAVSPEELNSAYKLRYEVFSVENGDNRYTIGDSKLWKDCDDNSNACIFIAVHKQETIGTLRYTPFFGNSLIAEEKYDFALLSKVTKIPVDIIPRVTAREDRGVVSKNYRSLGVFLELERHLVEQATRDGIKILVVAHKSTDPRLNAIFEKNGWKSYKDDTHEGFSAVVAYKLIGDSKNNS